MDKTAVKDLIISQLQAENVKFTESAIERLLDPRYLREEALAEVSDAENRKGVEKLTALVLKRFRKRTKRSKAVDVTLREIDTRTVARDAFGEFPPYQKPAPAKPAEATPTEGENPDETAPDPNAPST
jgi:uncharacterized protein with von Willebrand factor type A (vWA) domain